MAESFESYLKLAGFVRCSIVNGPPVNSLKIKETLLARDSGLAMRFSLLSSRTFRSRRQKLARVREMFVRNKGKTGELHSKSYLDRIVSYLELLRGDRRKAVFV